MQAIKRIRSRTLVLAGRDIDTDQIIPARYLTTTQREGLGQYAFADWRYDSAGELVADHVLNRCDPGAHQILVAGRNFGCGSSREHAPWALLDFGFRAVVSTEIADIFKGNALKNGLLPVLVDEDTHRWLLEHPAAEVEVDLETSRLTLPDGRSIEFPVDAFSRYCLLRGVDQLGFLLDQEAHIRQFEARHEAG